MRAVSGILHVRLRKGCESLLRRDRQEEHSVQNCNGYDVQLANSHVSGIYAVNWRPTYHVDSMGVISSDTLIGSPPEEE